MLYLFGHVVQTKQILATQFHFRLRTPDLVISVSLAGLKSSCVGDGLEDKGYMIISGNWPGIVDFA